jgi:broad specificity phosphatase PhoE
MPQETTRPKTIYLIRHGETGFVKEGRFYGSTDLPLSDEGREQARALHSALSAALGVNYRCYVSPMQRAQETLHLALPGIAAEIEPALREINFGKCEGLLWSEIQTRFPNLLQAWADFSPAFEFPAGERLADYLTRVETAANRLAADPCDTLAVFAHTGILRSLICHFLHLPAKSHTSFKLPCTGVATVILTDGWGVLTHLGMLA